MTAVTGFARALRCRAALVLVVCCALAAAHHAAAENIKIALLKVGASAPFIIAQEKGYFTREGLSVELLYPDQPAMIAQGTVGGELDFGIAAPTAAFYNLARQGTLRIIAANSDEAPRFKGQVLIVSNAAFAGGLQSIGKLAGRSSAITIAGSPQQYILGMLAQKYRFDYASLRLLALGSFANMIAAVAGGSADSAVPPGVAARQAIDDQKLRNLAWVSDEMRMTIAVVMTSARIADEKPDLVKRFLNAYRAGTRDYHDTVIGPDERPAEGPGAGEMFALIAKSMGLPITVLRQSFAHIDAQGRLDVDDVLHQIAWYKSQGMVKPEVDGAKIIDRRYVVPLPEKGS